MPAEPADRDSARMWYHAAFSFLLTLFLLRTFLITQLYAGCGKSRLEARLRARVAGGARPTVFASKPSFAHFTEIFNFSRAIAGCGIAWGPRFRVPQHSAWGARSRGRPPRADQQSRVGGPA